MRLTAACVVLLAAWDRAAAQAPGAIALSVQQGPGPTDVTLSWTGSQPTFEVYHSADASTVESARNKAGETDARLWVEPTPALPILYYEVLRKPDPPATIVPGAASRILLTGTVVGPDGPFEGDVLVVGHVITCVAPSCSSAAGAAGATKVATNGIILPGLIDAHNHGLYDIFDETDWTPQQIYANHNGWTAEVRYQQTVDAKQYLAGESRTPVDYGCEMDKYAEIKALIAGTTAFLLAPGPSRPCFASLVRTIDTPENDLPADKVQTSVSIPSNASAQSVCNNFASGFTDAYVVHVAEGVDQAALDEFYALAAKAGGCLLSPKTTIVHGTALGLPEFQTMAAHGMKLVWSPKLNLAYYDAVTRIDLALEAGVSTIALGPDWSLGGSVNLLDELRFADEIDRTRFGDILSPQRLFEMVTIDAARALAVDGLLGSLSVGKRADITVIGGYRGDPYGALLLAEPTGVRLVLVDGRALYGDAQLVAAGPRTPGCESVPICGAEKFMCIAETSAADRLDQTYAEILTTLVNGLADYDAVVVGSVLPFSPIAPLTPCP